MLKCICVCSLLVNSVITLEESRISKSQSIEIIYPLQNANPLTLQNNTMGSEESNPAFSLVDGFEKEPIARRVTHIRIPGRVSRIPFRDLVKKWPKKRRIRPRNRSNRCRRPRVKYVVYNNRRKNGEFIDNFEDIAEYGFQDEYFPRKYNGTSDLEKFGLFRPNFRPTNDYSTLPKSLWTQEMMNYEPNFSEIGVDYQIRPKFGSVRPNFVPENVVHEPNFVKIGSNYQNIRPKISYSTIMKPEFQNLVNDQKYIDQNYDRPKSYEPNFGQLNTNEVYRPKLPVFKRLYQILPRKFFANNQNLFRPIFGVTDQNFEYYQNRPNGNEIEDFGHKRFEPFFQPNIGDTNFKSNFKPIFQPNNFVQPNFHQPSLQPNEFQPIFQPNIEDTNFKPIFQPNKFQPNNFRQEIFEPFLQPVKFQPNLRQPSNYNQPLVEPNNVVQSNYIHQPKPQPELVYPRFKPIWIPLMNDFNHENNQKNNQNYYNQNYNQENRPVYNHEYYNRENNHEFYIQKNNHEFYNQKNNQENNHEYYNLKNNHDMANNHEYYNQKYNNQINNQENKLNYNRYGNQENNQYLQELKNNQDVIEKLINQFRNQDHNQEVENNQNYNQIYYNQNNNRAKSKPLFTPNLDPVNFGYDNKKKNNQIRLPLFMPNLVEDTKNNQHGYNQNLNQNYNTFYNNYGYGNNQNYITQYNRHDENFDQEYNQNYNQNLNQNFNQNSNQYNNQDYIRNNNQNLDQEHNQNYNQNLNQNLDQEYNQNNNRNLQPYEPAEETEILRKIFEPVKKTKFETRSFNYNQNNNRNNQNRSTNFNQEIKEFNSNEGNNQTRSRSNQGNQIIVPNNQNISSNINQNGSGINQKRSTSYIEPNINQNGSKFNQNIPFRHNRKGSTTNKRPNNNQKPTRRPIVYIPWVKIGPLDQIPNFRPKIGQDIRNKGIVLGAEAQEKILAENRPKNRPKNR